MMLPVSTRGGRRVAAVAVCAQDAAFRNFGQQIRPATTRCNHSHFAALVAQVIELQNHRVSFSAHLAGVLAQILEDMRQIAVTARQATAGALIRS